MCCIRDKKHKNGTWVGLNCFHSKEQVAKSVLARAKGANGSGDGCDKSREWCVVGCAGASTR